MENCSLSVGVCAHNEQETIGTLLEQALEEDIPIKEILVAVAGNDSTADVVREKAEKNPEIELIKENGREGQTAAQNKILGRVSGDALLFLDGDGVIESGSLEALYDRFSGENVVSGKEIPSTGGRLFRSLMDAYSDVHHEICTRSPRFSTHLGIVPTELVEKFPEELVLDDAYIEHKAREEEVPILYEPEAVKHHNMPSSLYFFFRQQEKNWAGRFQAENLGLNHSKPEKLLAKVFLECLKDCPPSKLPVMTALGVIESAAYLAASARRLTGSFPVKWWRPI